MTIISPNHIVSYKRFGQMAWISVFVPLLVGSVIGADSGTITSLTAEAASELLAAHDGPLDLSGLDSLSSEVAAILATHDADLYLDGLSSVTTAVATALAAHGSGADNPDPEAIAARVAQAFEAGATNLDAFQQIVADFSGGGQPATLSLAGLTTLSPDVADALAGHIGGLNLDGLNSLSAEAATALANHLGALSLGGLTTLPDDVAEILLDHAGEIFLSEAVQQQAEASVSELVDATAPTTSGPVSGDGSDGS
jgi:hypothetical protein